jgi:ComF family protein
MSNLKAGFLNRCASAVHAALPAHCVLCGTHTAAARLCHACRAMLPAMPSACCAQCALPLASGAVCAECLERRPRYDAIAAAYAYDFPVDALIQSFKYRGDLSLAPLLANALARRVPGGAEAIVPMPLSRSRLAERGFNQAHELARHLARVLRLPLLGHACRKVAETPPQAGLTLPARVRNVKRAFVCDADLTGARVAIVDDVMTTGATMNELARVLKRAGAAHVSGWVVARALRQR